MKKINVNKEMIVNVLEQFARGLILALIALACAWVVSCIPYIKDTWVPFIVLWGALIAVSTWAAKKLDDFLCEWLETHVIYVNVRIRSKSK